MFILCVATISAYATHNRAGEITYRQVDPLTIEITITTYTKTSSQSADRDSLLVFWGDGTSEMVGRINGEGEDLGNDVKKNLYVQSHTYPGRGTFTVSFTDPNRVGTILNVNYPNSIDVPFYLGTTFTFLDPQFQGSNSSAILLQAPVDQACVGKVFTHNPNAYDADGDSLSYELVPPQMAVGEDVPGYRYPDEIGEGSSNSLTIDPITGMIRWDSPQIQGEYNIAIKIKEWRKGVLLNEIIRDMQILVMACDNDPPIIETETEICITAGDLLDIPIKIDDINAGQKVILEHTGGPFQVSESPALLEGTGMYSDVAYEARLKWQTTCDHISNQYYQVVLKATDDAFSPTKGLSTLHTIRIKVIGPRPEDLIADNQSGQVRLSWQAPYVCDENATTKFQGFSVWRKKGVSTIEEDTCTTGIIDPTYKKIIFITKQEEDGRYFIIDPLDDDGSTYCYKVLAEFASTTSSGNPYNRAESRPSQEACILVARDLPLMTKVSVTKTDAVGTIDVHWTRPKVERIDTDAYPPPYTFTLSRSDGNETVDITGYTVVVDNLDDAIDTIYIDNDVNTITTQYSYTLHMKSGNERKVGSTSATSSIYLEGSPSDHQVTLQWSEQVPWSNYTYDVYTMDNDVPTLLATTTSNTYTHKNLVNGQEVCYRIVSTGKYGLNDINEPLINQSQVLCITPTDDVAPCAPSLMLTNNCSTDQGSLDLEDSENLLNYAIDPKTCSVQEDIQSYNVYFKIPSDDAYSLVENIDKKSFLHDQGGAEVGCYVVTAIDNNGNESPYSNEICTARCPKYTLPNTFTPNDDGYNDVLTPIINKHVASIEFTLFNTWGNILYTSTLPELEWKGIDSRGNKIEDGVYYYTCIINYDGPDSEGKTSSSISGYIQIIR